MNVVVKKITDWMRVVNAARKTSGKAYIEREPKREWRARMLLAEHSPIRLLEFDIDMEGIRQWVTVHYVRHHIGVEKFVHSQREDRRVLDVPRDQLPQGAENDMMYSCNAQALINISRKRLCNQASKETREVWVKVKEVIGETDPEMASKMVPECIYRGFCPEMKPCGYCFTKKYQEALAKYRKESLWSSQNSEQ